AHFATDVSSLATAYGLPEGSFFSQKETLLIIRCQKCGRIGVYTSRSVEHPRAMRYFVVATDYDGTIASNGRVEDATLAALERVKASGRRLVLVTGRHLPDLSTVFPQLGLFARTVMHRFQRRPNLCRFCSRSESG